MKYGLHTDGRKCGPIAPTKVSDAGWVWYATEAERYTAIASTPPQQSDIEHAIDSHILAVAQAKGYRTTESCISYIGGTNTTWDAEARAFRDWREGVWEYVIAELAKVEAGTRTLPTLEEAIAELPLMVWPT